jgi:hypothetical protein
VKTPGNTAYKPQRQHIIASRAVIDDQAPSRTDVTLETPELCASPVEVGLSAQDVDWGTAGLGIDPSVAVPVVVVAGSELVELVMVALTEDSRLAVAALKLL